MESQIIKGDSNFCGCEKELVIKIVPYEEREQAQDIIICEQCGKPEPDPFQFTFDINSPYRVLEPEIIYPTLPESENQI